MKPPKIVLYTPDGTAEHYSDCKIDDSLIPDLSFEGTSQWGARHKILTNLAYKIVHELAPEDPATIRRVTNAYLDANNPWQTENKSPVLCGYIEQIAMTTKPTQVSGAKLMETITMPFRCILAAIALPFHVILSFATITCWPREWENILAEWRKLFWWIMEGGR